MGRSETAYQRDLIKRIQKLLPGSIVLKNNPDHLQGVPDILVLHGSHWAMLEVKLSHDAEIQPNQEYYVDMFNDMSFSAFIYPEVEEEVLNALQSAFGN